MKQDDSPSLYTSSQAVTYEWNSYPLFNKYRCNRITTLKPTPITYFLSVLNKNRNAELHPIQRHGINAWTPETRHSPFSFSVVEPLFH